MKSISIIIVGVLVLSSCERETTINIPPQVPKLATESFQGQNAYAEAKIVRTRSVTDPMPPMGGASDPYVVNNVMALLYEGDVLKDTLKYDSASQKYKAALYKIQESKTYKLILSSPNYPTVEATSFTPTMVPINNLAYTKNARQGADGIHQDEIKITFTDFGSTGDYYLIRVRDVYGGYDCAYTKDKDVEKLVYDDPLYGDDCIQSDRILLSDINFNGLTKTVIFYIDSGPLDPQTSPSGIMRATVELLHINNDFFKYLKSLNSYENAVDNPFAEPVNLFSNAKNGYGMFTTYGIAVDSIR